MADTPRTPTAPAASGRTRRYETTEADLKRHSQELGWMGGVFGSRENAPTYVAGVLTLLLLVIILYVAVGPVAPDVKRDDLIKTFGGFFLAALGYLFGSVSGKK